MPAPQPRCVVPGCEVATAGRQVRVFRLPKDPAKRKLWMDVFPENFFHGFSDSDWPCDGGICCEHFPPECLFQDVKGKISRSTTAVPSLLFHSARGWVTAAESESESETSILTKAVKEVCL